MVDRLQKPDSDKLAEAKSFFDGFESVILASMTDTGLPHSSYAPFIADHGRLCIYVSGLAKHATTLKNGHASLLFIEDEKAARTVFARKRLILNCQVSEIEPDNDRYIPLLEKMQLRFGSTLELLRSLPDFILYQLEPTDASFVTGFGAAFDLSTQLEQLLEPGQ